MYNKDNNKLRLLLQEYELIKNRLEALCLHEEISEFTRQVILDMSNKVLEHIARNYQEIQKGVKSVMGGKILDYEAKRILNRGISQGISQGITRGKFELLDEMVQDGVISVADAAKRLDISVEEFQSQRERNNAMLV